MSNDKQFTAPIWQPSSHCEGRTRSLKSLLRERASGTSPRTDRTYKGTERLAEMDAVVFLAMA
jgi:hypothetical protein